jgi:two-component system response regulator HupR/HoxA
VRVIAATNRNLDEDLRSGRFREDLYFRLATIAIHVPPLRERPMDFPLLADRVLDASCSALGKTVTGFRTDALAALATYDWPGNVRELQNEILRMVALANGPKLGAELLSPRVLRVPAVTRVESAEASAGGLAGSLKEHLEQLETRVLKSAMQRHRGNKSRVARELGLSRVGLRAKLARFGLEAGE